MVAGDNVTVSAGDYSTQRVNITNSGVSGSPITYSVQGQVVMKGFVITANYVTIDGFEVTNSDIYQPGITITGGSYNLIENNNIHDNKHSGIWFLTSTATGTNLTTHDNIIRHNNIHHNNWVGIYVSGRNNIIEDNSITHETQNMPGAQQGPDPDGIWFFGQGHIIRRNYIYPGRFPVGGNNPDYVSDAHIDCFQTYSNNEWSEQAANILFEQNYCDNLQFQDDYEKGQGWMMEGGANHITIRNNIVRAYRGINTNGGTGTEANYLYIYNNTFINNLSFPAQPNVAELPNPTYSVIENNIFYDMHNATLDISGDTTGLVIDYNLSYNSDGSQPVFGYYIAPHELNGVNPQFVNPAVNDYHLQPTSPVINAGITLSNVTNDYDGNSRPQGAGYDIGAYEYASGGTPTSAPTPTIQPTASPTMTPTAIPSPTPKPGDANGDSLVNETDFTIWLSHFGQTISGVANGDFNGDGRVDGIDYTIWLNNYGK